MKKMYSESDIFGANHYRKEYLAGVRNYADELSKNICDFRTRVITPKNFSENQEYYRKVLLDMLGYPLNNYCCSIPKKYLLAVMITATFTDL